MPIGAALSERPGDNHRLLELFEVQSEKLLDGQTVTLSQYYQSLLGEIGMAVRGKSIHRNAQERLLRTIENSRDAVSGVSVEEEMIAIMRSRRIYEGALKYIKVLDNLLADLASLI